VKLLIFGLGYSGLAIAKEWDGEVVGTTRSAEKAQEMRNEGIETVVFDGELTSELKSHISTATHMVLSASPSEQGDPVLLAIPNLMSIATKLEWIGYLSTVGVYGDFEGQWISEATDPKPVSKRGKWRVQAEKVWMKQAQSAGVEFATFRLAGIYGPGRSTFEKLRKGTSRRIVKKGQVFNRIHVADIAQIVNAAAKRKAQGVFNGADDEPAAPNTVIEHAAKMISISLPPEEPFETADMTPMARSFYGDNKRCGNARLKKDLGIQLRFPTYREGLESILSQMSG